VVGERFFYFAINFYRYFCCFLFDISYISSYKRISILHKGEYVILGLITARGGSTRLPRKNAKLFCGHPLVAWSIIQSKCSKLIDETVLTTDDDEIAAIGERYGAKVIRRPVWDNDTTAGVPLLNAIEELEKEGIVPDHIVTLLPTSPVKLPDDLDRMIAIYLQSGEDQIMTVSPDREHFIFENLTSVKDGYRIGYHVKPFLADKYWKYSNLCGGWGVSKRDWQVERWRRNGKSDAALDAQHEKIFDDKILCYSVLPWQVFETDYLEYFNLCELIMEKFVLKGRGTKVYTDYAMYSGSEYETADYSHYAGNMGQQ